MFIFHSIFLPLSLLLSLSPPFSPLPPATVCSARVIFESDLMQDFLCLQGNDASKAAATPPPQHKKVEMLVLLPDGNKLSLNMPETAQPSHVLAVRACLFCVCVCVCVCVPSVFLVLPRCADHSFP